jgi:hypothetical protein
MSRKVMRVPLDFNHPLEQVWPGYCSEPLPQCPACDGAGETAAAQWLARIATLLGQLGEDVPRQFIKGERGTLHPYLGNLGNRPTTRYRLDEPDKWPETIRPSADILDFLTAFTGLPADKFTGFLANPGHDIFRAMVKHAGLPEKWGWCLACDGTGTAGTPEQRKAAAEWTATEPPAGDGWQLWETVSEGSPITPVFATKEELARHIASTDYAWHRPGRRISLEAATALVEDGWAPSGAFISGQMVSAENAPLAYKKADTQ